MSSLKLGRWVCLGLLGLLSAAACGGRGALPFTDSGYVDEDGGEPSFGGTTGTAGKQSGGKAGTGKGGSAGVAGAGGAAATCKPNTTLCYKSGIATCTAAGTIGGAKACPKGTKCVANGANASCVGGQICNPSEVTCDDSGTQVVTCSADGTSLSTTIDCAERGQRCLGGKCQSAACQPNEIFCENNSARLCSADGTRSTLVFNCAANQYCDPATLSCQKGICAPNQPSCNGDVAVTCNAKGSGYSGKGTDCSSLPDRTCVQGSCMCTPTLADCDGSPKNGCEINVGKDPDNCGTCDVECSSNHVSNRTCNGTCNGTCQVGYGDCNGDKLKDGCETSVSADVKNCGGCGVACSTNHVSASCSKGVCNGACAANFADCNQNKQADGCESDSRTDVKNCGACGVACSANHVKAECASGTCSGTCAKGFLDCNMDKQRDGCEINTQTDSANCGGCNKVCAVGESCNAGKCSSLYTFSGIAQELSTSTLVGWSQCYVETYGQATTLIEDVQKSCSGSLVMLACRAKGSSTLQLAAYAPREDVFFDTGSANEPHNANGVGWYFSYKYSWGFAPEGDTITRSSCDIVDSALSKGVDGDKRLCWHTQEQKIGGGWRCGLNDNLNADGLFERLMFTAQ